MAPELGGAAGAGVVPPVVGVVGVGVVVACWVRRSTIFGALADGGVVVVVVVVVLVGVVVCVEVVDGAPTGVAVVVGLGWWGSRLPTRTSSMFP